MEKILIFDYDGVIVDSLAIFKKALIDACQSHGFNQVTDENFLAIFNDNMYGGLRDLGVPTENIPTVLHSLKERLLNAQNELHLFPGMQEALEAMSGQHKIFIITSNISEVVEQFLASQGITYYQEVIGGEKEPSKVLKIKRLKGLFPDREYFYVGDTRGDMIEGKEAGAKTIAVTWGWHQEGVLREERPDYIVHSPAELAALFA